MRHTNNRSPDRLADLFKVMVFLKVPFRCLTLYDQAPFPLRILKVSL